MKKSGRYDVSGLVEAQFEPGSRGRVLRNRLGIKSSRKMDDVEASALKDGFPFAAANRVPALMEDYSRKVLGRRTPCRSSERAEIASALAETHAELVLIHPFREGNGRIARVLATLMALQAGLPPLDFSLIAGRAKECLLHGGSGRDGSQLPADGEAVRRNYRPEPCRTLTGSVRSSRVNARAMVSVFLPVSTEVLLDTLVMSALRRPSASRR